MQILKNKSGITLVALIITIIILLILAGVSWSFVFNGGILDKAQQAVNEYENASKKEEGLLDEIDSYLKNELGGSNADGDIDLEYNSEKGVNKPKLTEGMIPVKYNASSEKWVITNENDEEWYDYNNKQWANIMLSDGKYKTSNPVEYTTDGTTEVDIADLGSMFVWIPRYAYKIESGYHSSETGTIEVEFLKGRTSESDANVNIVEYNEETTQNYTKFPDGYVVHPAFSDKVDVGGWNKNIEGIWVAKFEAGYEASTTGNITGIYDMSGGMWDFIASLIPTGNSNIESFGGDMAKLVSSTEYVTLYPVGNSTAENTDIDLSYPDWGKMYGDAIWETSLKTNGGFAWNGDRSNEKSSASGNAPFIVRGGSWNMTVQTGSYCFANNGGGNADHVTFRVSFIIE